MNFPLFSGFSTKGINKYKNDAIIIDKTIILLSFQSDPHTILPLIIRLENSASIQKTTDEIINLHILNLMFHACISKYCNTVHVRKPYKKTLYFTSKRTIIFSMRVLSGYRL